MFEVKLYNPVMLQRETVLSLPESGEDEAMIKAEEFLFSQGVKCGELFKAGANKGKLIYAYKDEDSIATRNGGFGFLPSSQIYFIFKHIKEVLGIKTSSFLDLGCGPGNILMSARNLLGATELAGVEIDDGLVRRAKNNTRSFNANIIQADILEWAPAVNDFDMIYMYEPIRDKELRLKFLSHLKDWLNDGQYVFYLRAIGETPEWLKPVDLAPYPYPCLFTFDKSKG